MFQGSWPFHSDANTHVEETVNNHKYSDYIHLISSTPLINVFPLPIHFCGLIILF